ncbi:hypothetical protein GCM10029978_038830 [Actinoallomurus acanthiterrae]
MTETTRAGAVAVRAEPEASGGESARGDGHGKPVTDDRERIHDGVRGEPLTGGVEGVRGGLVTAATMTEVPVR